MTPRLHATTALLALVLTAGVTPAVMAQAGPLEPRLVVAGQPYPKFEPDLAVDFLAATAQLSVDVEGRVTDVKIIETSGNPRFDDIVRDYYSKFRLIPGVNEAGQPVAATSEVRFRVAVDDPVAARLRGPDDFVAAEVKRIRHMNCDDFIWEYDRMQEIAHGHELDQEYLFQTSFAMVEATRKLTPAQIERATKKSRSVLKDTAKQCRANPDSRFFADAYQPAVLKRAGHTGD